MKRELELAELLKRKPVSQNIADARKNRAQDEIVVGRDLREHHTHDGVRLVPTRDVSLARRSLECGKNVEKNAAVLLRWQTTSRVHKQEHERPLSAFAALAFQRDHAAK